MTKKLRENVENIAIADILHLNEFTSQ